MHNSNYLVKVITMYKGQSRNIDREVESQYYYYINIILLFIVGIIQQNTHNSNFLVKIITMYKGQSRNIDSESHYHYFINIILLVCPVKGFSILGHMAYCYSWIIVLCCFENWKSTAIKLSEMTRESLSIYWRAMWISISKCINVMLKYYNNILFLETDSCSTLNHLVSTQNVVS